MKSKIFFSFLAIAMVLLVSSETIRFVKKYSRTSLGLSQRWIYSISGIFDTTEREAIKDCIKTLNSIELCRADDYIVGERSPLEIITFKNRLGMEIGNIYFYDGRMLRYERAFFSEEYLIDMSEHEKLEELCRKYEELRQEEE